MVAHAFNHVDQEQKQADLRVPGQSGLHSETLAQKQAICKKPRASWGPGRMWEGGYTRDRSTHACMKKPLRSSSVRIFIFRQGIVSFKQTPNSLTIQENMTSTSDLPAPQSRSAEITGTPSPSSFLCSCFPKQGSSGCPRTRSVDPLP